MYVQETANQMKVEERILYTEIARIRKEKVGDPTPVPFKAAAQQLVLMREVPEAG